MKAFIVDRYSKQDPMRLGEMPQPELREDDVLIEIHAAGLNLLDSKIESGEFKLILPYRMPLVLGHDVAGVVARVGSRARQFNIGDEVHSRPTDHSSRPTTPWPTSKQAARRAKLSSRSSDD